MDEYDSWLSDAYGGGDNIDYSQFDIGNIDLSGLDYSQFNLDPELLQGVSPDVIDDVASALQYGPEGDIISALQDIPSGYGDIYGGVESVIPEREYTTEEIAAMQDQDQLWSMGPKGVFTDDTEPGSSGGTKGSYGPGGPGALGSYKGASYLPGGAKIDSKGNVRLPNGKTVSPGGKVSSGKSDWLKALLPLMLMMAMRDKQSGGSKAVIPALTASQRQTPYSQQRPEGYRPGQGGIRYFEPVQYMPRMAGGGIVDLARALAAARREQRSRLLKGRGDGVSDSIPATIDGERPARLARGEYVVDARTVAELGNGSTDAGAERLDEMRRKVLDKRKKAGVGQDSKAYKHLPA